MKSPTTLPLYNGINEEKRRNEQTRTNHLEIEVDQSSNFASFHTYLGLVCLLLTLLTIFLIFCYTNVAKYIEPTVVNFWLKNKCSPLQVPYCLKHNIKYSYILLPNELQQVNQDNINVHLSEYNPLVSVKCYALLPLFLCSLYTPFCNSTFQPIAPCKSLCQEAVKRCDFFLSVFSLDWPFPIDCDLYLDDNDPNVCVGFEENKLLESKIRSCDGFQCDNNRCIFKSWVCDGFMDCQDGSDEKNCSNCSPNQFFCGDKACIDKGNICDGGRDCPDGRDERQCWRLRQSMGKVGKGRLEIWSAINNTWDVVCADNWNESLSNAACQMLGYKYAEETRIRDKSKKEAQNRTGKHMMQIMFYKGRQKNCSISKNKVSVRLKCRHFDCGKSAIKKTPSFRIVGGDESKPGTWPWLVGLHGGPFEIFFCAGVLISQMWVLTAAHCIGNHTDTLHWKVKLGLTRRTSSPFFVRERNVTAIIKHSSFNSLSTYGNDIALLLLQKPIEFDEFLRPVCLPTGKEQIKTNQTCIVIGWGKPEHNDNADYLNVIHEVSVPIVNHSLCKEWYQAHDMTISETMLCAGYPEGAKDACQGDSGGPLLCQNKENSYFVAGIVSWGVNCAQPSLPGIYTNVMLYQNWIKKVTKEYNYSIQ